MLTDETLPAEGPRYASCLVFVPGLWVGRDVWRGFATFLAHRGWECRLLDPRGLGGFDARAAALVEYAAALPSRAVLIGHDAGALVALAAAGEARAAAAVLIAPLVPGSGPVRTLMLGPRSLAAILLGRPVPPPRGRAAGLAWGELPGPARAGVVRELRPEDTAVVVELVRRRITPRPAGVPTLVLVGDRDPLLAVPAAAALAQQVAGEQLTLAGAGHWPLAGPLWQRAAGLVHRWVVQRLGEPLLERYAEAMAEREDGAEE